MLRFDNIAAAAQRLFYTIAALHMIIYTRVMNVYIELYALDNLLMDALLLRMAAAIVGRPCRIWRLLIFSAAGAALAIIALFCPLLLHPAAKLGQALLLGLFIPPRGAKQYAENTAAVIISACIMGGTAYALGGTGQGMAFLPRHMRFMIMGAAAALGIPRIVRGFRQRRTFACGMAKLNFFINGKEYELTALRDSGCLLCEPVSGAAVVIAYIPALLEKAKIPVPMETVQGWEMIYAIKPEKMAIDGADTDALLAISPQPIKGAQAIIPYHIAKEKM